MSANELLEILNKTIQDQINTTDKDIANGNYKDYGISLESANSYIYGLYFALGAVEQTIELLKEE